MDGEVYIYVLRLTDGRYYVGKTHNVEKRYQEHCNGNGSAWTRRYAPLELIESYQSNTMFEEDRKTKQVMNERGIENVRGGTYVTMELDPNTVEFLQKEIWTGQDKCGRCGCDSHHIVDCKAKRNIKGERIEKKYYR